MENKVELERGMCVLHLIDNRILSAHIVRKVDKTNAELMVEKNKKLPMSEVVITTEFQIQYLEEVLKKERKNYEREIASECE